MGAKSGGGPVARWTIRRAATLVGALILAATFAAACHGAPGPLSVQIDPVQGLPDEPVSIRITGLDRAERVQLRTDATDYLGQPWRAEATFVADGEGVVDLAHRQPVETSYDGSDPMALFWGMDPVGAPANETGFDPPYPELQAAFDVVLTLTRSDQTTYQQPLRREWTAEGVTHRRLDIATDGVAGDLFLPAPGAAGPGDRLWPSEASANAIGQGTRGHVLIYRDAGHALGLPPYLPKATRIVHPVTGDALNLGGTRPADAAARVESWRAMLHFLADS